MTTTATLRQDVPATPKDATSVIPISDAPGANFHDTSKEVPTDFSETAGKCACCSGCQGTCN